MPILWQMLLPLYEVIVLLWQMVNHLDLIESHHLIDDWS